MINQKKFCRSLEKEGGTIILSWNDQPSIGGFSIGKEGSALGAFPKLGAFWELDSGAEARGWWALPRNIDLKSRLDLILTIEIRDLAQLKIIKWKQEIDKTH